METPPPASLPTAPETPSSTDKPRSDLGFSANRPKTDVDRPMLPVTPPRLQLPAEDTETKKEKFSRRAYFMFLAAIAFAVILAFVIFLFVDKAFAPTNQSDVLPVGDTGESPPPPAADQSPTDEGRPTPTPTSSPSTTTPMANTQTFNHSYLSGFEAEWYRVTLSLPYDGARFSIAKDAKADNTIIATELATKRAMQAMVFNNSGAGFGSSKEFWGQGSACKTCKEESLGTELKNAKDVVAYGNATDLWVVYFVPDSVFIVTVHIPKPDADFKALLKGLEVRVEKAGNPNL